MGRLVALDFGEKRTGVASTDELQIIATGLTTVNTSEILAYLIDYCDNEKVDKIIIGEPRQMDGSPSLIEDRIQKFIKVLNSKIPNIPIERQDERFTSMLALQSMKEMGVRKKQLRDKKKIDQMSATLILQSYLERKVR